MLRECRERETFAHNAVNDAEEAYRNAEIQMAKANITLEWANRSWERAKTDLANVESTVKK